MLKRDIPQGIDLIMFSTENFSGLFSWEVDPFIFIVQFRKSNGFYDFFTVVQTVCSIQY